MEQFLSLFVDNLQKQYQKLQINQFAEIHGYICFESDLGGKERLVLRELIQKPSNGDAFSSECSKTVVFQAENAGKGTHAELGLTPEVTYTAVAVRNTGSHDSKPIVNHAVDAIPMCVIDGVWSDNLLPAYPSSESKRNIVGKQGSTKPLLSVTDTGRSNVDTTTRVNPLGGRKSLSNPRNLSKNTAGVDNNEKCAESYDSDDFDTDMQVTGEESHPYVKVCLATAPAVDSNDDPDCIILDDDLKPEVNKVKILPSATESQHALPTQLPAECQHLSQATQEQPVVTNSEMMIQPRRLSLTNNTVFDTKGDLSEAEYIDLVFSNDDAGTSSKPCHQGQVLDADDAESGTEEASTSSSKNSPTATERASRKRKRNSSASEALLQYAVNRFISYNRCSKNFEPNSVTTEKLDTMLFEFFSGARTKTGQPLSASSLQKLQINLDRAWSKSEHRQSAIMITSSKLFPMSTAYIRKISGAKKLCLPKVKDVKTLFHNKKLGSTSPATLLNSMWFMNFKFFGIERPSDHYDLEWGDIILKQDEDGTEYLKLRSQSKGSELLRICADPDKPAMCFVSLYKQYAGHRPENMKNMNSPFYLKPNSSPSHGGSWFQSNKWHLQAFFNIWNKITQGTSLGELF